MRDNRSCEIFKLVDFFWGEGMDEIPNKRLS